MAVDWPAAITAAKDGATATAILIGGIVGYYKYLRGRVFHPRLEVNLTLQLIRTQARTYAHPVATIRNVGIREVELSLGASSLRIFKAVDRLHPLVDESKWERLATLDLSGDHEWVESSETVCESWWIDVTDQSQVDVFKVVLSVVHQHRGKPGVRWTATASAGRQNTDSSQTGTHGS